LGNPSQQPHLVRGLPFEEDPQRFKSTLTGFGYRPEWRLSWMTHAESFWDTPLQMRYSGLDPAAQYRVRIVYAGDAFSAGTLVRLRLIVARTERCRITTANLGWHRAATAGFHSLWS